MSAGKRAGGEIRKERDMETDHQKEYSRLYSLAKRATNNLRVKEELNNTQKRGGKGKGSGGSSGIGDKGPKNGR